VAPTMKLEFVRDFYEHPAFIRAYAEEVRKTFGDRMPDRLLLSFHGLPERHVKRTDASGSHCLQKKDCCAQIVAANRECYRAQCFATTRALARELGLASEKVIVSFQSRLGRTPWIQPFTDVVIPGLPSGGVKSLVVACPSFAADCLETIEEMGDRGRRLFADAGGVEFRLASCPNSSDSWARGVVEIARSTR
ncbi:MAG: ferrochelatase, partial [Bdellovibrionota bacterium]